MFEYTGRCKCKAVSVRFTCPKLLPEYQTRICDCDYCLERKIEYLSDPQGSVTLSSNKPLKEEKQGSGQATFLLCTNCLSTLAVSFKNKTSLLGCINASCLDDFPTLIDKILITPKTLSDVEKVERWRDLWSPLLITPLSL